MTEKKPVPEAKEYVLSRTNISLNNTPMYVGFENIADIKNDGKALICVEKFDYDTLQKKCQELERVVSCFDMESLLKREEYEKLLTQRITALRAALEIIGNSRTLNGEDTASAAHAREALQKDGSE